MDNKFAIVFALLIFGSVAHAETVAHEFDSKAIKSIQVRNGSGDIQVKGTRGRLTAEIGSGNLIATELAATADVKAGSGDLRLSFAEAPKGKITLKTGSGDQEVVLPKGTKVLSDFKAGSGRIFNEFGDTEGAGIEVVARAGSGDLRIKKAQ